MGRVLLREVPGAGLGSVSEGRGAAQWIGQVRKAVLRYNALTSQVSGKKKKAIATNGNGEVGFSSQSHHYKYSPLPGIRSLLLKSKTQCTANNAHPALWTQNEPQPNKSLKAHPPSEFSRSGEMLKRAETCKIGNK